MTTSKQQHGVERCPLCAILWLGKNGTPEAQREVDAWLQGHDGGPSEHEQHARLVKLARELYREQPHG